MTTMTREEIMEQVLRELANEGNEKAKLVLRLTERNNENSAEKALTHLTQAVDKLNKASEHTRSGMSGACQSALDQIRMNIHAATIEIGKL